MNVPPSSVKDEMSANLSFSVLVYFLLVVIGRNTCVHLKCIYLSKTCLKLPYCRIIYLFLNVQLRDRELINKTKTYKFLYFIVFFFFFNFFVGQFCTQLFKQDLMKPFHLKLLMSNIPMQIYINVHHPHLVEFGCIFMCVWARGSYA